MTIRPTTKDDLTALAAIADAILFPGEMLSDMIAPALSGEGDDIWLTALKDGVPVGFCYTVRETFTEAAWNMRALAVDPAAHRSGIGASLVATLEDQLRDTDGEVLVIDTASDDSQSAARAFYAAQGYTQSGTIPSFWEGGNDKVTYWKTLTER